MLILDTFGPNFGEPDASPFCLKAMCLLTMSGVEWKVNPGADSRKAPARKLPVLHDGNQIIPDSDAIRFHLESHHGADFDAPLNKAQRAQSRAVIRMVEEHLYFCIVYDRWKVEQNWMHVKKAFFADQPLLVRTLVPQLVRKSVLSYLDGQGMGRLSYEVMLERASLDLQAVEHSLGDAPFLFGKKPVSADISVACILVNITASPEETPLKLAVCDNARLMRYIADARQAFYPSPVNSGE